MSSSVETFRSAVGDEGLPLSERRGAAEHYIAALVAEVPEPAEDDDAVIALLHPPTPKGDEMMDRLNLVAWKHMNHLRGWRESGGTQA